MSDLGYKDPDEVYPLPEYHNQPTTNKAAREEWEPYIKLPDGAAGAELIQTDFQPKYPYNKVEETSSGHRIEHDDTPGEERLSYAHMSGTGVEMYPDGSLLVNSYGRTVQLVGDTYTMIVNGNGELTFKGDLNINVEGDFNVNCANFTVNGAGRRVEQTRQTKVENYTQNRVVTTKGTRVDYVVGNRVLATSAGNWIVSGKTTKIASGDDMSILAGDNMFVSAEDDMNLAADNMRVTGINTTIVGDSGTIGGDNVVMYSKSLHTDTVDATTIRSSFVGDLKGDVQGNLQGNADTATQAGSAGTAGAIGAGGSAGTAASPSVTEIDATTTAEPNRSNLTEALTRTKTVGIRNVDVDDNKLQSTVTGGIGVADDKASAQQAAGIRPDTYEDGGPPPGPENGAATERYNNPGGMYPADWQAKYGAIPNTDRIGGGHLIAGFPTKVDGAAAQMALLQEGKYYRNESIQDAISTWSGGNNVDAYLKQLKAQGIDTSRNVSDYTSTKQGTIDLAKAMAYHEKGGSYSMTADEWSQAYDKGKEKGWM